jgi:hypothetical protein
LGKKRSEKDIIEKALKKQMRIHDWDIMERELKQQFPGSVITFIDLTHKDASGYPEVTTVDCARKGWRSVSRYEPDVQRNVIVVKNESIEATCTNYKSKI